MLFERDEGGAHPQQQRDRLVHLRRQQPSKESAQSAADYVAGSGCGVSDGEDTHLVVAEHEGGPSSVSFSVSDYFSVDILGLCTTPSIWGGHTRPVDEVSPTQSRISPSIQRIRRKNRLCLVV